MRGRGPQHRTVSGLLPLRPGEPYTPDMTEARSHGSPRPHLPRGSRRFLSHLVPTAFGIAAGTVIALALALATAVLVWRGGEIVGPHLSLLGNYLPGYSVTWPGVAIGAVYGMFLGFVGGFLFATIRNITVALYLRFIWTRFQHHVANDLLDRLS